MQITTHALPIGGVFVFWGCARISQTVSSVVTDYLLDVQPGLAKVISATTGANTDRFVHSPRGIHALQDNGGTWSWTAQDGLGSVRMEVSDALGNAKIAFRRGSVVKIDFGFWEYMSSDWLSRIRLVHRVYSYKALAWKSPSSRKVSGQAFSFHGRE